MTDILSNANVGRAYHQVVSNKGAPGIDGMTTDNLQEYLGANWPSVKSLLEQGKYHPQAVRRVEIPKAKGGTRKLGIPTVLDRMIQQAIAQEMVKYYEAKFSDYSYGFRPQRGCHDAIDTALEYLNADYTYLVEIDLSKFFDRVNHDRLMHRLSTEILDKEVLRLIRRYLQSGVMEDGIKHPTQEGTPQGGNLSPVLSNIVLDELDKELEERGHKFVRYADDITIFVKSKRAGERVLASLSKYIETKLKLKVNQDKSGISHYSKGGMLGFGFYNDGKEVQCRIAKKSYENFKNKLKGLTSRSWSISLDNRLREINWLTQGWISYYGKAKGRDQLKKIDKWVRRRLRMVIWKQWKKTGKRIRSLIQLGIPRYQAYQWANTRKSYWRTSKSPILQRSVTTARLLERGYVSILEKYNHRHSILMNRRGTRPVCQVV